MFLLLTITPLLGRQNNNEAFLVLKNKKNNSKRRRKKTEEYRNCIQKASSYFS